MKKIMKFSCILIVLICASSCTYVYYPNYPVIPQVKENSGGVQATIGFSKAQISGWYCLDSNVFFTGTVSGALSWLEESSTDTNNHRRYHMLTATGGAGYQYKFGDKGQLQIIGGGGVSQGRLFTSLFNPAPAGGINFFDPMEIEVQSVRGYLQPSVGFAGKGGGFHFIPRITYEKFIRIEPTKRQINEPMTKRSYLIAEPFLMGRINSKAVNVDIYGGFSFILNSDVPTSDDVIIVTQPLTFGIGLSKVF